MEHQDGRVLLTVSVFRVTVRVVGVSRVPRTTTRLVLASSVEEAEEKVRAMPGIAPRSSKSVTVLDVTVEKLTKE